MFDRPGPGRRNPPSRREQARRPPLLQDLLELMVAQAGPSPSLKMMALQARLAGEIARLRRLTG